jgi:hypothetical protein
MQDKTAPDSLDLYAKLKADQKTLGLHVQDLTRVKLGGADRGRTLRFLEETLGRMSAIVQELRKK